LDFVKIKFLFPFLCCVIFINIKKFEKKNMSTPKKNSEPKLSTPNRSPEPKISTPNRSPEPKISTPNRSPEPFPEKPQVPTTSISQHPEQNQGTTEKLAELKLILLKGNNLDSRLVEGKECCNPYALVSIADDKELTSKKQTVKTKICHNTISPTWDLELVFKVPATGRNVLIFEVFDHEPFNETPLGFVLLPFDDLELKKGVEIRRSCTIRKSNGQATLEILLTPLNFNLLNKMKDDLMEEGTSEFEKYFRSAEDAVQNAKRISNPEERMKALNKLIADLEFHRKQRVNYHVDFLHFLEKKQLHMSARGNVCSKRLCEKKLIGLLVDASLAKSDILFELKKPKEGILLLRSIEADYDSKEAGRRLDMQEQKDTGYAYFYENGNRYFKPPVYKGQTFDPRKEGTMGAIASMFFSWVAYSASHRWLSLKIFSGNNGYPYLKDAGEWQIVLIYEKDDFWQPFFMVWAVNWERGVVIPAFRGSEISAKNPLQSIRATINDLDCLPADFYGMGMVYRGFYEYVAATKDVVMKQAELFLSNGYAVLYAGHSLGSCLANMMAMLTEPKWDPRIMIYMFAVPNFVDETFQRLYNKRFQRIPKFISEIGFEHDFIASVIVGWKSVGYEYTVVGSRADIGNPHPIKGVQYGLDGVTILPDNISAHFQEVYMNGVIRDIVNIAKLFIIQKDDSKKEKRKSSLFENIFSFTSSASDDHEGFDGKITF